MRPASDVLPADLYARLTERHRTQPSVDREGVVLDIDREVAARLRAQGPDWRDRAAEILRKAVGL